MAQYDKSNIEYTADITAMLIDQNIDDLTFSKYIKQLTAKLFLIIKSNPEIIFTAIQYQRVTKLTILFSCLRDQILLDNIQQPGSTPSFQQFMEQLHASCSKRFWCRW